MQVKGTPKSATLTVTRKMGDNNYGSFGVEATLQVDVAPDANLDEVFDSMDAYLTAKVGRSLKDKEAKVKISTVEQVPTHAPAPQNSEIWDNPQLQLQFTNTGQRYLNVKGGKWMKYGCPAWPENVNLDVAWQDWDATQVYNLPDGFSQAVVQLKEDGKPDRVISFR